MNNTPEVGCRLEKGGGGDWRWGVSLDMIFGTDMRLESPELIPIQCKIRHIHILTIVKTVLIHI